MSSKPRLLDLFCGAGGAAMGYHCAGFDVVGVDIAPQPNYPFEFHQGDAMSVLAVILNGQEGDALERLDAIHASPPCQSYSKALKHMSHPQPELIDDVRELLRHIGLPWVIENVVGAPLPHSDTLDGQYGVEICGTQLGLRVGWHRLFETSFPVDRLLRACQCSRSGYIVNPYNAVGRDRIRNEFGQGENHPDWPEVIWRRERGTEWMNRYEGREAIPPAYTEFVGEQLLAHVLELAYDLP